MKKRFNKIAPVTGQIAGLTPAAVMGIEPLQHMKTRLTILKFLVSLWTAFAATAVFGQTPLTFVWTNQTPANVAGVGDMNLATNWNPNGVPNPMTPTPDLDGNYGDLMIFDGLTTGPLKITENGGSLGGGGGQSYPAGARILLTSNQTSPVTIFCGLAGTEASPTASTGLRMNWFAIEAGAGGLNVGINSTTNIFDIVGGEVNGQIFGFTNNCSTPCVVNPDVKWRMGGAGAHPHIFTGSGDWIVKNHMRSANSSAIVVQKFGPGTMTWIGTNVGVRATHWGDSLGTPITIGEGTMIWKTSDLVGVTGSGNPNIVHNGTLWKYDVQPTPGLETGPGQIVGTISGAGPIQINAGTLTLSGQNTISGNWTLSGGTLIAGSAEVVGVSGPLGQNGTISFSGGTLQYSANNAVDYSSRFSTAPGQAISIDTAGQIVTYATDLTSTGGTLTKLGNGELTLAGTNTYNGLTTVSSGSLTLRGPKTGTGNITVADGATLGVFDGGTPVQPTTLTVGTGAGANLQFDNVTNTSTAPLVAGAITSAGPISIGISSETLSIGQSYPLLTWSSGSAPAVSLGIVEGGGGFLTTNGSTIKFNCTSVALVWSGANNGIWDAVTANNWKQEGSPIVYANPKQVVINDTATGETNITIAGVVQPESVTINNSALTYSITSSSGNNLGGNVRFGKRGNGEASLAGGANANTGVTTLKGGTLIVSTLANGGSPSDLGGQNSSGTNLVLNGGALRYTGAAASVDRLFTVASSGGTIANEGTGPLTLNNPAAISHSGGLTLGGSTADTNTLASALIGGGSVTKSGTGTWILTGTNGYAGGTTIANGVLQIGANGGVGSIGIGSVAIGTGNALDFKRTGTLTVPGAINGNGALSQSGGGTVILANNNGYTGGTTINAGTLQVGNGGGSGSLYVNGPIVNNSRLVFNTSGSYAYQAAGLISGTGNVIFQGGGTIKAIGANNYTGWTQIDANTTFFCREGQDGALASPVVTNSGTLRFVEQNAGGTGIIYAGSISANTNAGAAAGRVQIGANNVNVGQVTLTGTNTYTGGTFIGGNELILGDNATDGAGAIAGNVQFVNNFTTSQDNPRTLTFNRPDSFTFGGSITTNFASAQGNRGIVQKNGAGVLTLTGNNTYGSGTVINAGTVQVGSGGTSGSLGFGPVTDNGILIFNRARNLDVGAVSGVGTVLQVGSGNVILGGTNTYTGLTTISNGVLAIGSGGASSTIGDVEAYGGYLAPGGFGAAIGALAVNNLTLNSAGLLVSLNRSSSPSNSFLSVAGTITQTGGKLKLLNFGPALLPGDKFTICSQAIPGGNSMAIISPGFTVVNNLAVDGSVTVATVSSAVATITPTESGGNINLSWPADYTGLFLQGQTNSLAVGLANNWVTIPGTDATNFYSTLLIKSNAVFFRLQPR